MTCTSQSMHGHYNRAPHQQPLTTPPAHCSPAAIYIFDVKLLFTKRGSIKNITIHSYSNRDLFISMATSTMIPSSAIAAAGAYPPAAPGSPSSASTRSSGGGGGGGGETKREKREKKERRREERRRVLGSYSRKHNPFNDSHL